MSQGKPAGATAGPSYLWKSLPAFPASCWLFTPVVSFLRISLHPRLVQYQTICSHTVTAQAVHTPNLPPADFTLRSEEPVRIPVSNALTFPQVTVPQAVWMIGTLWDPWCLGQSKDACGSAQLSAKCSPSKQPPSYLRCSGFNGVTPSEGLVP